jgi:hypothetical protein
MHMTDHTFFFDPTGQNPPSISIKEIATSLQQITRKTVPNLKGLPSRHTSSSKETKYVFNIQQCHPRAKATRRITHKKLKPTADKTLPTRTNYRLPRQTGNQNRI